MRKSHTCPPAPTTPHDAAYTAYQEALAKAHAIYTIALGAAYATDEEIVPREAMRTGR